MKERKLYVNNPLAASRFNPTSIGGVSSDLMKPTTPTEISSQDQENFSSTLNSAISALDQKQAESNNAIQGLVTGQADDLHTVMVKTTEAQLSLELAVQLRNKSLEAFNELKNMQF